MVDTIRTLADLQTLFADNTAGDISAQDLRDFLVSSMISSGTQNNLATIASGENIQDSGVSVSDIKNQDTVTYSSNQTLTDTEARGYVVYVDGAATITLPEVSEGMNITVITIGAIEISIDPNASDKIWLDGTALDDGDKITNSSTAGDLAVLTYFSADGWHASTNNWTDGGA